MKWKELSDGPHRRLNPLTREWVLVSPQRAERPWQGRREVVAASQDRAYEPDCYLCPGNERAGGKRNPAYTGIHIFENDFPALLPGRPKGTLDEEGLIVAESETGICRVVCFSPRHDLTIPRMDLGEVCAVVDAWIEQNRELGAKSRVGYIQIFENRGELMGASNPHPHCQIWATAELPNLPAREQKGQEEFRARRGACLLCRYLDLELERGERIVFESSSFVALVPFWAVWPFESMLLSRRHLGSIEDLDDSERRELASVMRRLTIRYDNLFETAFPYSMGFHQRPSDGLPHPEWHFHAHFFPPLLRSAAVQKFMVGYELLAEPQRDITAESAAARLRELRDIHYSEKMD